MFEIFKKDIKVGETVRLYLITGKEPEGIVEEIGDVFVVLKNSNNSFVKFFDKIIGGWDVIEPLSEKKEAAKIPISPAQISKTGKKEKNELLETIKKLSESLKDIHLNKSIHPNGMIIKVFDRSFIAANKGKELDISKRKIVNYDLLKALNVTENQIRIPIVISFKNKDTVNAVSESKTVKLYLNDLTALINSDESYNANGLLHILRPELQYNALYIQTINLFKELYRPNNPSIPSINQKSNYGSKDEGRKAFLSVEKEINSLIRLSEFENALIQIENELQKKIEDDKYTSTLLLKKAQIYSSLGNPERSELAYQDLIRFNEKIKAPANNLSHLYTELARLQSADFSKLEEATISVRNALKSNPNNFYANNLLRQIQSKLNKKGALANESEDTFENQIEIISNDDDIIISKLIDIDIKEYKYRDSEILQNQGKPTAMIARRILDEARQTKNIGITERYPAFLEAAKAFSELNVGSYNLHDYQESVAYYSMLKGNALFINFKNLVIKNDTDLNKLLRLRDSACSYYLEALNLLSNINPKSLIVLLSSYLQIETACYYLKNGLSIDKSKIFKLDFPKLFNDCIYNKEKNIVSISLKTIIDCGSNSVSIWNKLNGIFQREIKFNRIFSQGNIKKAINELLNFKTNVSLQPSVFLTQTFKRQKALINNYTSQFFIFSKLEFEPYNFTTIKQDWDKLNIYTKLLNDTDVETKIELDRVILIIQPYLHRSPGERINILLQVRRTVEKQIKFINENTTYYGRSLFFNLLLNWKRDIDNLLEEKVAQDFPFLNILIDPPYYIETENEVTVQLLIKNEGQTTSEGLIMNITIESTEYEEKIEIPYASSTEIPAGNQIESRIVIPPTLLEDSKAIELFIKAQPVYQGKKLAIQDFQFTVEQEPDSYLNYEDIPWKDGPVPPKHLFMGRKGLISDMSQHYLSIDRDKPYILYGLTRTGKSSILEYLEIDLDGEFFTNAGKKFEVVTFKWDLQEISNNSTAREFYTDILNEKMLPILQHRLEKNESWDPSFSISDKGQFKDLKRMLELLKSKHFYAIFFIDELSYIKDLMDRGTIGSAFLAALREYSLKGLASFVFAGTYDIKKLISDERYGITGQFVHTIDYQVDNINKEAAIDLINVIENKLTFTPEAIEHILHLSGRIPYFIQIICKSCGDYAVENRRKYIGYPELEKVVRILIGQEESKNSLVTRLTSGKFQNNQLSTTDPLEVSVLMSSISFFNKDLIRPRGVGFHELERLWHEKGLTTYKSKLANSIQILYEKKILIQQEDDGLLVYKFAVDFFRRWWYNHHQDINLELTTLIEE